VSKTRWYSAALSDEYFFVYDISHSTPVKKQVLHVPNALEGLAWSSNRQELYVGDWINGPSGFVGDEIVARWFQGCVRWQTRSSGATLWL
jgi:hypothetical protein